MASINGIQIKAFKYFKGHEGESLTQGNIYLNGKKVGWYTEDSWGGPISIDIEKEHKENFNFAIDSIDIEDFMFDLIELTEYEKEFKKIIKKGYKSLGVVNAEHESLSMRYAPLVVQFTSTSEDDLIEWLDDNELTRYKTNGKYDITLYTELSQFEIKSVEI